MQITNTTSPEGETTTRRINTPAVKHTKTTTTKVKDAGKGVAGEAVEAAVAA